MILLSITAEQVTAGKLKVEVKYGIIPVYSATLQLCTVLQDAGISCPVAPGAHSATVTETVPGAIPSVSSALNAPLCKFATDVGQTRVCVQ